MASKTRTEYRLVVRNRRAPDGHEIMPWTDPSAPSMGENDLIAQAAQMYPGDDRTLQWGVQRVRVTEDVEHTTWVEWDGNDEALRDSANSLRAYP